MWRSSNYLICFKPMPAHVGGLGIAQLSFCWSEIYQLCVLIYWHRSSVLYQGCCWFPPDHLSISSDIPWFFSSLLRSSQRFSLIYLRTFGQHEKSKFPVECGNVLTCNFRKFVGVRFEHFGLFRFPSPDFSFFVEHVWVHKEWLWKGCCVIVLRWGVVWRKNSC